MRRFATGSDADCVLLGGADALSVSPEALAAGGHEPLILIAEPPDGAIVLLAGAGSRVDLAFATPNLDALGGRPDFLEIARDRELPRGVEALGGPRPVAIRLALNGRDARPPAPTPMEAPSPPPPAPAAPSEIDDAILERKLRRCSAPCSPSCSRARPPAPGGAEPGSEVLGRHTRSRACRPAQ